MDKHWIYYAKLMKPAIGSSEDDKMTSKEIWSFCTWLISKQISGTHDANLYLHQL